MDALDKLSMDIYGDEKEVVQWCSQQKVWRHDSYGSEPAYWERGEEIFAWRDYVVRAIGVKEGMERTYIVKRN